MKIALSGPSGGGKTTLSKFISQSFDLPYLPGSAGLILKEEFKDRLRNYHNWEQSGHRNVINLSGKDPEFGYWFQKYLLESRSELYKGKDQFITDRSPLDNVSYFMQQTVHNCTEEETEKFITHAQELYQELTHLIRIKWVNEEEIEDNGSRIPNKYYQYYSDAVFEDCYNRYFKGSSIKVLTIDYWDLDTRFEEVSKFINHG